MLFFRVCFFLYVICDLPLNIIEYFSHFELNLISARNLPLKSPSQSNPYFPRPRRYTVFPRNKAAVRFHQLLSRPRSQQLCVEENHLKKLMFIVVTCQLSLPV